MHWDPGQVERTSTSGSRGAGCIQLGVGCESVFREARECSTVVRRLEPRWQVGRYGSYRFRQSPWRGDMSDLLSDHRVHK